MPPVSFRAARATFSGVLGVTLVASACSCTPATTRENVQLLTPAAFARHAAQSPENLEADVMEAMANCHANRDRLMALERQKNLPVMGLARGQAAILAEMNKPTLSDSAQHRIAEAALRRCEASTFMSFARARIVRADDVTLTVALGPDRAYKAADVERVAAMFAPRFTVSGQPQQVPGVSPTHIETWASKAGHDNPYGQQILSLLAEHQEGWLSKEGAYTRADLGKALLVAAGGCAPGNVALLLSVGADPNVKKEGRGVLDEVCNGGDSGKTREVVELLLKGGADPKQACLYRSGLKQSLALRLLEAGADPNRLCQGQHPLSTVLADRDFDGVRALLERGAKPTAEHLGLAVAAGRPDVAALMLEKGATPNATTVSVAIQSKSEDLALTFVKRVPSGLDVDVDVNKSTLLHQAAAASMDRLVAALLGARLLVDRPNRFGELPLDSADAGTSPKVVALLKAAGGHRADPAAVAAAKQALRDQQEREKEQERAAAAAQAERSAIARERREQKKEEDDRQRERQTAAEASRANSERNRIQGEQAQSARETDEARRRSDAEKKRQNDVVFGPNATNPRASGTPSRSTSAGPAGTGAGTPGGSSSSGAGRSSAEADARKKSERDEARRKSERERDEQVRRDREATKLREDDERRAREVDARKNRCRAAEEAIKSGGQASAQCKKACSATAQTAFMECHKKPTLGATSSCQNDVRKTEDSCSLECEQRHKGPPLPAECQSTGVSR